MRHTYNDPNICYAIGDCFSVVIGTAQTDRRPASGVFEEVSTIIKPNTTDTIYAFDVSDISVAMIASGTSTPSLATPLFNLAWKIGNTVYIRKAGSTDYLSISGVQVDA